MNKILTKSLQLSREIVQTSRKLQFLNFSTVKNDSIKKSVFISQSNDVYTNLALEDWFYKNNDFTNHHILMLWQNDPCVVIGRHQNPWEEVNVVKLKANDINLARRNSGGGTVYHDAGNLNLTFFTSRKHYNRKYNLELIAQAIVKEFGLKLTITPKFDILYNDFKVSGTASKLGRNTAYHHCTLLVNVNKEDLKELLQTGQNIIQSNATKSIPSPVMNLREKNSQINVDTLMSAIGWEYLRTNALELKEEGSDHLKAQQGFQLINPTEQWFPGLEEIRTQLKSWDWCYGKTPKFSVSHKFSVPYEFLPQSKSESNSEQLSVKILVANGLIEEVFLNIPSELLPNGPEGDMKVLSNLEGKKYTETSIKELEISLSGVNVLSEDKKEFVTNCFRKVMMSA